MLRKVCVVVVLGAIVGTAQAAGSESVNCIVQCLGGEAAKQSRFARSPLSKKVFTRAIASIKDAECEQAVKCLEACPKSNLDRLVQQVSRIISGKCDASEEETQGFVADSVRFQDKWLSNIQQNGCTDQQASSAEEFCRVSKECVLGKALDASKSGDDAELVAFSVAFFKFGYLTFAEQRFGGLPSSCDALYEAYQPQ